MLKSLLALAATAAVAATPAPSAAPPSEALAKLQAYMRLDTTNPPGHEAAAAHLLASWLQAEGITPTLYESAPGRFNLVARLKGSGKRAPLLLLNHMDVVPVETKRWQHPPFAAMIADGALYGRGALDMKDLGIMQLLAFLDLKRSHAALTRDVVFCATADEEAGGQLGAAWMLAHHPEDVRASEVLSEGGSGVVLPEGTRVMNVECAEKGVLWVKLVANGMPGHGSIEGKEGAVRRLVHALARLDAAPRPFELGPEAHSLFKTFARTAKGERGKLLKAALVSGGLARVGARLATLDPYLGAQVRDSLNPTMLEAGQKVNVLPGTATAQVDIRLLPGHDPARMLAWVRQVVADRQVVVSSTLATPGSRSATTGPLWDALVAAVRADAPGVAITSSMSPGASDSRFFRAAGAKAFGFSPFFAPLSQYEGFHGDNEHILLNQLDQGTRTMTRAVALAATR
ncbi:MAG: peptidase [Cyanobacteria bacterium RYN_339]|nr:peptidase [Cyanobacteria bacterium RYN_339]